MVIGMAIIVMVLRICPDDSLSVVRSLLILPLMAFFTGEWLCLRHLPLAWHGVNIGVAIVSFLLGDPGYAILFIIFACLYSAYLLMVHRRSVKGSHQLLAR